ncbi:hypothetical protein F4778DRAFT_783635 [Xylariomycetidae sp. FL2044]|nr:hypothetical protein F4778DRAFT_783635 [Xylariomycetidae sp. FL2044]
MSRRCTRSALESRTPEVRLKHASPVEAEAELTETANAWSNAWRQLTKDIVQSVERYQQHCNDLSLRRNEIIHRVSQESPLEGATLEAKSAYIIPDPTSGVFDNRGLVFSFRTISAASPCAEASSSLPSLARPASGKVNEPTQLEALTITEALSTASGLTKPLLHQSLSGGVYHPTDDQDIECREGELLGLRVQNGCANPVFSKHPLYRDRAKTHFEECGMPYKDERDMVRRYARLVLPDRKGRSVNLLWAQKINRRLLASDEAHLESENLK